MEKAKWETFGTVMKDIVTALRDSVLFLLFLLLVFAPTTIKDRLVAAGFTKGAIAGFEWEAQIKSAAEQTKSVGQTVEQASANYENLIARLTELEKQVTDPKLKAEVKNIGDAVATSRAELKTADRTLKASLATQQQIVAQIKPSAVADTGWIFIGNVTEDKNAWSSDSTPTVSPATLQLATGTKLTLLDDVYVRADSPSNTRSSAPILGVAQKGEVVEVIEVSYSSLKGGGWSVWVKVRRS